MRLEIYPDYAALSHVAGEWLINIVRVKPAANLVLALGNTPVAAYEYVAAAVAAGRVRTHKVNLYQLDEYLDVPVDDRRSLYCWLMRACVEPLQIPFPQVHRLLGFGPASHSACQRFEQELRAAGGIDAALLGLGLNGHIGFNEPGSSCDSPTRVVGLTAASIASSATYWGNEANVPRQAVTMGLGVLKQARRILLLVNGAHKAEILARAIAGPVTREVPATCLRHLTNYTVMVDEAAVSRLPGRVRATAHVLTSE